MDAHVEVGLSLGDVTKGVHEALGAHHQDVTLKPRYLRRTNSVNGPNASAAYVYLTLGGPPIGFYWTIRSMTVWKDDAFQNLTWVAFVGAPPIGVNVGIDSGNNPSMNMGDLAVVGAAATVFFSEHSVNVMPGEEIIVFSVNSETGVHTYGANATITELPLEPRMRKNYPNV